MNLWKKAIVFFLLLAVPLLYLPAQSTSQTELPTILEAENIPQWVKDTRRWEIIAFGSIPFTLFTATFAMDMYRWNQANNLDFSTEGRRYAPWPLKSAGAVVMESKDQELVFVAAAGLSISIAFTDMIIVQIKRYKARKRAESLPVGSTIITRTPLLEETPDGQDTPPLDDDAITEEAAPVIPEEY